MKRTPGFMVALAVGLVGCHPASDSAPRSKTPPPIQTATGSFTKSSGTLAQGDVPLLEQIDRENIRVVSSALPSVVRVKVMIPVDPRIKMFGDDLPFKMPFGDDHKVGRNAPAFGSGVIISSDGYIVTNHHVVAGAKDVQVQLSDQRIFPAHVVGSDEPLDVALVKIEAKDLPALPLGNSDAVEVGEQVFAIGNPFDLDDSVTKGMISAKGRSLGESIYQEYLQTDAAINPGNSGGALVNIHGEFIGMNTAIISSSGYSMGVGFAIPSNLVRSVVEGLLKQSRGYLGVIFPKSVADGIVKRHQGALISGVIDGSPAQKVGLQAFDIITSVDGNQITSISELRLKVAGIPVGKEVKIDYIRDGKSQTKQVTIADVSEQKQLPGMVGGKPSPADKGPVVTVLNGLKITALTGESRQQYHIDSAVHAGVVVSEVAPGSPADLQSLTKGDVIESASAGGGVATPIGEEKDFNELAASLKPGQSVILLIHHGKTSAFLNLTPDS